jgi:hypothetical protein
MTAVASCGLPFLGCGLNELKANRRAWRQGTAQTKNSARVRHNAGQCVAPSLVRRMRFLRFDCRDNRPSSVFVEDGAKRIGVRSVVAHQPGIRGNNLMQVPATTLSSVFRGSARLSTFLTASGNAYRLRLGASFRRWPSEGLLSAVKLTRPIGSHSFVGADRKGVKERSNETSPNVSRNSAATKHSSPRVIGKLLRLVRAKYRPCAMPANARRAVAWAAEPASCTTWRLFARL